MRAVQPSPPSRPQSPPQLCLFGAAPSTGNLGVSALYHSAVAGVLSAHPLAQITVFDFGRGSGPLQVRLGTAQHRVTRMAANNSKRFWRMDSMACMRLMGRLGGLGNPAVRVVRNSQAVWDVSGGDSFTDLYGEKRFWTTTHPKFLALELGRPLVLLPQTYGPFETPRLRTLAEEVTRKATVAWARDERSFEALRELLGPELDPARHRVGVDLAFGLPTTEPRMGMLDSKTKAWLGEPAGAVGINVSGLIYLDPSAAKTRYGFRADYAELIDGLVRSLVERGERVILVPHVIEPKGNIESDPEACARVREQLPEALRKQVSILTPPYTASEVKAVLGRLRWFCGTRMHSTIGSLSSGVPTAAVAYSLKFQGVFETCDQAEGVADPRSLDTREALAHLLTSYDERSARGARLAAALPQVQAKVQEQMQHLLAASGLA